MFFKKKINFIYFISAIFFYLFSFSFLISSELEVTNENFCETVDPINFIEQKSPDEIIIETNNPRGWATNLFKLFLEFNSEKYKTNNKIGSPFKLMKNLKKV